MATYFTDDFADFGSDWTNRYNNTTQWTVSSGDLVYPTGKTSDWQAWTWNDVEDGNHADIEVLLKLTTASTTAAATYPFVFRASGADESPTLYALYLLPNSDRIRLSYCAGSDAPTEIASSTSVVIDASTTYWVRVRINGSGTATVQAKIWPAADDESGYGWAINTTTTNGPASASGWNGVSTYSNQDNQHTLRQLGVGTNGDTAPSSAGGAATAVLTGLASDEAFGQPTVLAGAATAVLTGKATDEAFGQPTVLTSATAVLSGLASDAQFGAPTVVAGAAYAVLEGKATDEGFGLPIVIDSSGPQMVFLDGLATGEGFGQPVIVSGAVAVDLTGLATDEAFGQPAVVAGGQAVVLTGVATGEAFGQPDVLVGFTTTVLVGVASDEGFGLPTVITSTQMVILTGVASGAAFGRLTIVGGDSGSVITILSDVSLVAVSLDGIELKEISLF